MNGETELRIVCETVQVVEQEVELSLAQLCRSCGAAESLVFDLVAHGVLEPAGAEPADWRFGGRSLALTRRAQRLVGDLGVNAAGAAVALELLEHIERLQRDLR